MADFVIGGQINIDGGNAEKSVGNIKTQLKDAQMELIAMSDKFGATSREAINAAKKVGELKDKIGDAKLLSDAFNPDAKFKAFSNAIQGVVGGFAAIGSGTQEDTGGYGKRQIFQIYYNQELSQPDYFWIDLNSNFGTNIAYELAYGMALRFVKD